MSGKYLNIAIYGCIPVTAMMFITLFSDNVSAKMTGLIGQLFFFSIQLCAAWKCWRDNNL